MFLCWCVTMDNNKKQWHANWRIIDLFTVYWGFKSAVRAYQWSKSRSHSLWDREPGRWSGCRFCFKLRPFDQLDIKTVRRYCPDPLYVLFHMKLTTMSYILSKRYQILWSRNPINKLLNESSDVGFICQLFKVSLSGNLTTMIN